MGKNCFLIQSRPLCHAVPVQLWLMPGCIALISSGRFFEASPISSILLKNARFRVSSLTEASIKLSKGCFSGVNSTRISIKRPGTCGPWQDRYPGSRGPRPWDLSSHDFQPLRQRWSTGTNQYLPKMAILPFSANGIEKMPAAFCCCRIVLIFYS